MDNVAIQMFTCDPYCIVLYYQGIQIVHLGQGSQGSQGGQKDRVVQVSRGYPGHQASLECLVQGDQGLPSHHSNQGDLERQGNTVTSSDIYTNSNLYISKDIFKSRITMHIPGLPIGPGGPAGPGGPGIPKPGGP